MTHNPTTEDMAALLEEGTIVEFLLSTGGRSRKKTRRPETSNAPAIELPIRDPRHRPGAWPAGTRTDLPTCHPNCDCALHRPEES